MDINRHNYEGYFLLYADKELSAAEKSMVERFVEENSDLEEEFIMLQQTVVKPDTNITIDKSFLYKTSEFINENNYEEKFLLYADNELSLPEIEETEKFVLANSALQNEFTLLQQVKFEPDTSIVFPDKRLLYKKEDEHKLIPFRWKALAAAILLGIGLWSGINYLQQDKKEPVLVTNKKEADKLPVKPVDEKFEKKNKQINVVKSEKNQNAPPQDYQEINKILPANTQKQNTTVKNVQPDNKPQNKFQQLKNEDAVLQDAVVTTDIVKPTNDLPQPLTDRHEPNDKSISKATAIQNNNYAIPASYIEDEEKGDNYVFYNISAEEFKKSKVGNFLKKVKRTVEGRLPFKGSGLKIGNVEITKDTQN